MMILTPGRIGKSELTARPQGTDADVPSQLYRSRDSIGLTSLGFFLMQWPPLFWCSEPTSRQFRV